MQEIILNEYQIALNKETVGFRNNFLLCCYLAIIPTLCLFGLFFYLWIDYHALVHGWGIGFSIAALFYLGVIANIIIIYLTVGAGQFSNQLLVHITHNTTLKECTGHLNFINLLYRASAISPIVFGSVLMVMILYLVRNLQPSLLFYLLLLLFYVFTIVIAVFNFQKYQQGKQLLNHLKSDYHEVIDDNP